MAGANVDQQQHTELAMPCIIFATAAKTLVLLGEQVSNASCISQITWIAGLWHTLTCLSVLIASTCKRQLDGILSTSSSRNQAAYQHQIAAHLQQHKLDHIHAHAHE
jgi:hypothetical protein